MVVNECHRFSLLTAGSRRPAVGARERAWLVGPSGRNRSRRARAGRTLGPACKGSRCAGWIGPPEGCPGRRGRRCRSRRGRCDPAGPASTMHMPPRAPAIRQHALQRPSRAALAHADGVRQAGDPGGVRQYRSRVADLTSARRDKGNSVIDQPTEPRFNDRWQGESGDGWADRPGIVASLLRYRVVVIAATLLGAVAGYALVQLLPVRYQAEAVLILVRPWRSQHPRRRQPVGQQRPPGLPGQAGGHHDLHGRARAGHRDPRKRSVRSRGEGRGRRAAGGEHGERLHRRDDGRSRVGGRTGERGRHRVRAGHAGTRRERTRTRRSPASRRSAPATKRTSTPAPSPRTASSPPISSS